ncbi:MAG: molybdopterin-dependent oxidoreductase [Anaerolineaceae bacterium]|jgi:putative selenate reductase molybdopterin-binding subunit|nr:molybdopterin-dependent oxidoreductase [Anaerolineaceae bacterium]
MNLTISINQKEFQIEIRPEEKLLNVLRRLGFLGAKSGGCVKGECGACTVLMDGKPINSCMYFALQAQGHEIETIENAGEHPQQGWKKTNGYSILQQAFIESGSVQCGYCTPAMILAAKALLDENPDPSEAEVREALSGVLCRCTAYVKPVQAILAAAAKIRSLANSESVASKTDISAYEPEIFTLDQREATATIGKSAIKVDAAKLVQGKPAFTADLQLPGMLYAKVLASPYAHALIKSIDTSQAKALEGVAAVLTWEDLPRVVHSTAGQSDPIPGPLDTFSLDNKVRFVGDRVAMVAAETLEIADKSLSLIKVEYEELPPIIDTHEAMKPGAPVIHDEPEYLNFGDSDPAINLAAKIRIDINDVEKGFAEADQIFEEEYSVPKVQQVHIEPHVVLTWWDEDDRLVIRTSTQVPFHVRRMIAPVIGLPVKRIRVIKPRIGGGFGNKQEVLIEDVAAHLTIATGRPVLYEMTREEEFIASRSRHPMHIRMKTGVKNDGTMTANEMYALSDTGAYGCHALTVTGNTGQKSMGLYVGDGEYRLKPNIRFYADIVYTNTPPSGAYRGYGVPQGYWPLDRHFETIARKIGMDPIEFRLKNALRPGEYQPFSTAWNEGREPVPEIVHTVGLEECVRQGRTAIGWDEKFGNEAWHTVAGKPHLRRGIGVATVMQGTAIPYLDMGGAHIKINDDGSFNLLVGATDLGTGSDTALAQIAAEVLGVRVEDVIVTSSDTDTTPFDVGAYASSTTYISGTAVKKAAEKVAEQIKERAGMIFKDRGFDFSMQEILLGDNHAIAPNGDRVSLAEIALDSLHWRDQKQIMASASFVSPNSPPPFAAQFATVLVDIETGQVTVEDLIMAVDAGVVINPIAASGQIEGGVAQALGYGVCEEMIYDEKGQPRERDLVDYHIFRADEMPSIRSIFVQTYEETGPFGAKAVAEIPLDGAAPAIGNAVLDACGANILDNPVTPEKVWRVLNDR